MNILVHTIQQSLSSAHRKLAPEKHRFQIFKTALSDFIKQIDPSKDEEYHKTLLHDFLNEAYYKGQFHINIKDRIDQAIFNGPDSTSSVGVIIETKSLANTAEMITKENINKRALHELVLYYLRERISDGNDEIKHLIVTNSYEWFIFDAQVFDKLFADDRELVRRFEDSEARTLSTTGTKHFYDDIAKPLIADLDEELAFTHFDLRDYRACLTSDEPADRNKLLRLYKVLSPEHLLKRPIANDSNSLDKGFYEELLHIIGLAERYEKPGKKGKVLIDRLPARKRNSGSLLENAIMQIESHGMLARLSNIHQYGASKDKRLFSVALELVITWINRILFLKLMEAQLISYHRGDNQYTFLGISKLHNFDDVDKLFFRVLAKRNVDRSESMNRDFGLVPYLNSSLFEPTELEYESLFISGMEDDLPLPIMGRTVLKASSNKRRKGELDTLTYLFEFLDAYDFGSEGASTLREDTRPLINASVLGLIFEKINGYKDGSFYTPGFITMYMCRETVQRAVLHKFRRAKGWDCKDLDELFNKIDDKVEANAIINSLKICDPAVGSGHFLVSALNEIIAIKSNLKIILDADGRILRDYDISVVNDELLISREDDEPFRYDYKNKESRRVQEILFHEKASIIQSCLFGVDINPKSVTICRLRLWIELLKNAFYTEDSGFTELETLPNIDINIKAGNSLICRFPLDIDMRAILKKSSHSIEQYQAAIHDYHVTSDKERKAEIREVISDIKGEFTTEIDKESPDMKRLARMQGEVFILDRQEGLFEETKIQQKAREVKRNKLSKSIGTLKAKIDDINNSVVFNNAFEWRIEFPEVLNSNGDFIGFDAVIGNPPYIRQEAVKDQKPYLKGRFPGFYSGTADLYTFFLKLGTEILRPDGFISYITSNKYMRAGYGTSTRRLLGGEMTPHQVIDFGDLPVFEEATTYPSIYLGEKRQPADGAELFVATFTTKQQMQAMDTTLDDIGFTMPVASLSDKGWNLARPDVLALMEKLRLAGTPLVEYVNEGIYYGIKTGFNDAFVIDEPTKEHLIAEDPDSVKIIKPWLRGKDIRKWKAQWDGLYIINIQSSSNKKWLWTEETDKAKAEEIFAETYPAVYAYLLPNKEKAIQRDDQGRFWWELRSCTYNAEFERAKIVYPDISKDSKFCWDESKSYFGNTAYFFATAEKWMVGLLNSKMILWYYLQVSNLIRGGYMRFFSQYMDLLPIMDGASKLAPIVNQILADPNSPEVSKLEAEIDQLVYALYGLTDKEIKIVERD